MPRGATAAVLLAGAVADEAVLIDTAAGLNEVAVARSQALAAPTGVAVVLVIVGEVGAPERAVGPAIIVEHQDVRSDVALMDQPGEHLGRAPGLRRGRLAGVRQPLGADAEPVLRPRDHALARGDLGLAHRRARLDVHDDGMVEIDEVVRAVGEERSLASRAGPARGGIGDRQLLGRDRRRATERGVASALVV